MVLPENLVQGARPHSYCERQAGTVSVAQAATRCCYRTANGAAKEILAHRLRSYGYRPTPDRAPPCGASLASEAIKQEHDAPHE